MISRSTLLHLRIPFSFFLLPIFLFATFQADAINTIRFWFLFAILHLFVYPASNGYNSYFDKDESSIGGLENPPEVKKDLIIWASTLDLLGLSLSLFFGWEVFGLLLFYILASRAYSHPSIKLKRFPVIGLLVVSIFQGYVVFILTIIGLKGINWFELSTSDHFGGLVSSIFLLGSYPMTQIYQHEEDRRNGIRTISILLGHKGTFVFTGLMFGLSMALFGTYFSMIDRSQLFLLLLAFNFPTLVYFSIWFLKTLRGFEPDFRSTMRLNFISSLFLNLFFVSCSLFF